MHGETVKFTTNNFHLLNYL